jgi:hypothetical protein
MAIMTREMCRGEKTDLRLKIRNVKENFSKRGDDAEGKGAKKRGK